VLIFLSGKRLYYIMLSSLFTGCQCIVVMPSYFVCVSETQYRLRLKCCYASHGPAGISKCRWRRSHGSCCCSARRDRSYLRDCRECDGCRFHRYHSDNGGGCCRYHCGGINRWICTHNFATFRRSRKHSCSAARALQ